MPNRGLGFLAVLLGLGALSPSSDLVSYEQFEGKRIVAIRFEPPKQPFSQEYLAQILPIKPNTPFTASGVRESIKRLFATGRYSDIAVDGEPVEGGVAITFRTSDQWFIGRVEVKGKVKLPPNRGQLANATRLDLGKPFTDEELEDAARNVRTLLRENGFYNAKVEPETSRDDEHQQVHLVFVVDPGKRARFTTPIISGDTKMPPEKVAAAAKYKGLLGIRWKQETQQEVRAGLDRIRKKYQKQDRLMAKVRLRGFEYDAGKNRVAPKIHVQAGPKVKIETAGAKISGKKLKTYVPVFDEGAVDRDLLTEGARRLRDYFQSQGYFDVEVDFEQKQIDPDHLDIVYVVNLGTRQKVASVEVAGNKYFDTPAIKERLYTQPAGLLRLRHGRYSEGFIKRDEEAITTLYKSNGFRDVKVTTQTIDGYKGKPDEMGVVFTIDEGPQYLVSDFSLTGIKQLNEKDIVPMLTSAPGQPFSETNVAMDRDYIIGRYNASGFPDARFDWEMKPGPGPHQTSVHYKVTEGERRYVRDVLIAGMEYTRPRLVDPAIRLHPGDPLSLKAMGDMQRNLYDFGVFDKVDMAIQNPDGDTDRKYVLYQIEEGHRYMVAGGLGAELARIGGAQNDWSNAGGATGFSPRASLDVSRLNLWGLGHSLNFKGRVSSLEQLTSLNYLAPRFRNVDGRNISVTGLYDNRRDVRTFTSKKLEGSAQLSQKWSKATTVLYRYSWRRVSVDPGSLKIQPLLIPLLSQPAHIGMISSSWINDRRDDPTDAHKGIYSTVDLGLASRVFGGRPNFGRLLAQNATYHTFHNNFVFARRLQFGCLGPFKVASGVDPNQSVPLPERFFGGGSTSHRGFPDNQAGPRDPYSGFPLGGNAVLIHNTELRFPFLGANIDGVLFHDMGNVYSSPGNISFRLHQKDPADFDYMVHAVGFGIRYRTPVGPVRVDLAYSINPPQFYGFKGTTQDVLFGKAPRVLQNVSHFQFFFSIGQAF